jgi:flagella basal body P-ring formation protein FlgA
MSGVATLLPALLLAAASVGASVSAPQAGQIQRPAPLVKRGDAVLISVRSGALLITAPGRALSDGSMGDRVRVTNDATRRTLQAVVEGPARVQILTE